MSTLRTQALQHPSAAVAAITLLNTGTADAILSSLNSGPLAGFRNAIINGNFDIWQRATSHSTAGYGSADRWSNTRVGSSCTISRQAFTAGQADVPGNPRWFCRAAVTSAAGASNYAVLSQAIEDVRTFSNQTVTVSFWAKADAARPIAIELVQMFGTSGSAMVTSIGASKVTLSTTWQRLSLTVAVPSISDKTIGTADDCLSLNIWFDAGSSFNSRTSSLGQQSGTFDISRVQVEPGTTATPLEARPLAAELALCKRYGQWVPFNMLFYAAIAGAYLETSILWPEMRKAPVAAALVADPNTAQAAFNNAQNIISRITPYGGSCILQSSVGGTSSYVTGYRSWLDAEI